MPNPIIHFEIMGADSKKTQQYYADLFGWKVDSNNPMNYGIATTKDGEVGIDGGLGGADQGSAIRVTVYAQVDDPQAYLDKAVALGGTVVMGVISTNASLVMTSPVGRLWRSHPGPRWSSPGAGSLRTPWCHRVPPLWRSPSRKMAEPPLFAFDTPGFLNSTASPTAWDGTTTWLDW